MERTRLNLPDVINHSPSNDFTQIPNALINCSEISPVAFKIYCILLSNPHGWCTYIENIYNRMKCGYTAIHNALKELQDERGLLLRVHVRDQKTKRRHGSFLAVTSTPFEFEFNEQNIHPSLMNRGYELYYKSYIIETHIIETHIIEINRYINTINKKIINNKEKNIKKTNKKSLGEVKFPFSSPKFTSKWDDWKQYKSDEYNFKFKSPKSEQAALSELSNLSKQDVSIAIKIIDQSLAKGWKGFFALQSNGQVNHKPTNTIGSRSTGSYRTEFRKPDITDKT